MAQSPREARESIMTGRLLEAGLAYKLREKWLSRFWRKRLVIA